MKGFIKILWLVFFTLSLSLQGCGGGGGSSDDPTDTGDTINNISDDTNTIDVNYTGSESQAIVNEDNAKDLAVAAASSVKQAVDADGAVLPMQTAAKQTSTTSSIAPMVLVEPTEEMHEQVTAEICTHGGEALIEIIDEREDSLLNVFVLNNCSYGEGLYLYTFTGTARAFFTYTPRTSNHEIVGKLTTVDGVTENINLTVNCDDNGCELFSDFTGYDGRIYRQTEVAVTEEGNSVYSATGRIYDPTHGYFDVTTEIPFTLDCPNDRPGAGRLSFTGASQSSGTIEFISCDEYVVTTNSGTSNTYHW
ncbi:MAG: hypothetical protein AAES65_05105 [Candidatus Thiodiazotropha sp. (ex. Lucinoma kazani)]